MQSIQDGKGKGQIICVLENLPDVEPEDALWIPIIKRKLEKVPIPESTGGYEWREYISHAIPQQLDLVAKLISQRLDLNLSVTCNCAAAEERSPLAVMWFLYKYGYCKNLEEAFKFVKDKHSIAQYRLDWIPGYTKSVIE